MKLDRPFLVIFNSLARVFGILSVFGGIFAIVDAFLYEENRGLMIVLGIILIAQGIAFQFAKPVGQEDLDQIRRSTGRDV
jgi:uncharacterized membrane protein HdeD (DUF308 family)